MNYLYHIHRVCRRGMLKEGYIGITKDPDRRFSEHKRGGCNPHLDRALSKYDDVEITLISEGTRDEMLRMEAWLRPLEKTAWNIAAGGGNPPDPTGRPRTKETIEKWRSTVIGRKRTSESKKRMSDAQRGLKRDRSAVEKIRKKNTGKRRTDECKKRMAEIQRARAETFDYSSTSGLNSPACKGPYIIDGIEYETTVKASKALGVHRQTVMNRVNNPDFKNYNFKENYG